jgi:hypothetical protein
MKCYNPLYRLYDALEQHDDTTDLIAYVERSESVDDFVAMINERLESGYYPLHPRIHVKVLVDARSFAMWWQECMSLRGPEAAK